MASSLVAGRPPTACRQCKQQKVRCSGELPRCSRCSRANLPCAYIHGTKRSSLARHQTASESPRRALGRDKRLAASQENALTVLQSPDYLGVPESLVSRLIDTYFSHHYNARLLHHKAKLQQDREKGLVRPHVLLAICAIGAVFYRDEKDESTLAEFAPIWGERAGKLVLNEVETPNEDNLVTFSILTLFWYMQGAWRRSYIHKGNAMQTAHVLNLISDHKASRSPLDAEISRRRFWACYLTNCHSSNSMFFISPAAKLAVLPLPWRENEFEIGAVENLPVVFGSDATNGGIYGELIKAMTHWASVNSLVKAVGSSSQSRITAIHQLDAEIRKWWSRLPGDLYLTATSLSTFPRVDMTKVLLVHIAYHQCLCALHSSIVPLFSWGPDEPEQGVAQQLSAQLAYESACAISGLFEMVLDYSPDTSDFPSFLGYAAYCSYAIQIPFKWCLDTAVRATAEKNTAINLRVIEGMRRYWKVVTLLSNYAPYLAEVHSRNQLGLDSEPKSLGPGKLSGFRITAARARASILSLNGFLWKDDGYAHQGDEIGDLGLEGSTNMPPAPETTWAAQEQNEDTNFAEEDASATTLYDRQAAVEPELPSTAAQQPPVMFHPLLHFDMWDPTPETFDFANFAGMNGVDPW